MGMWIGRGRKARIAYGFELVLNRAFTACSNPDSCLADTSTTSVPIG